MPDITNCVSSFCDRRFPAARMSMPVLPAGKKILMSSAAFLTGAKDKRRLTTWHGQGTSFRKRPICSGFARKDGQAPQGKRLRPGQRGRSCLFSGRKRHRDLYETEDASITVKEQRLCTNRKGRDYLSLIVPDSGMKMRFW